MLVGVAIDREGKSAVAPFVKKHAIPFPILLDPEGAAQILYMVRGTPTTFIIDHRGDLVGMGIGPRQWDGEESLKLFRKLLAEVK